MNEDFAQSNFNHPNFHRIKLSYDKNDPQAIINKDKINGVEDIPIIISYNSFDISDNDILGKNFILSIWNATLSLNQGDLDPIDIEFMAIEFDRIKNVSPTIKFEISQINDNQSLYVSLHMQEYNVNVSTFTVILLGIFYIVVIIVGTISEFFFSSYESKVPTNSVLGKALYGFHTYYFHFVLTGIFRYMREYYTFHTAIYYFSLSLEVHSQILNSIWIVKLMKSVFTNFDYTEYLISIVMIYLNVYIFYNFLYEAYAIHVLSSSLNCFIFMNTYLFMFLINIARGKFYEYNTQLPETIYILFATLYQTSCSDQEYASVFYNLHWGVLTLFTYLTLGILLGLQNEQGALFMIPDSFRPKVFEKYLYMLKFDEIYRSDQIGALGLNYLYEPELAYYKDCSKFEPVRYPLGVYVKTKGGHRFHPNCILSHVPGKHSGPLGKVYIEIGDFKDRVFKSN